MKVKKLIILLFLVIAVTSCEAPKLGYFQDVQSGQTQQLQEPRLVAIEPGDKLSILVRNFV